MRNQFLLCAMLLGLIGATSVPDAVAPAGANGVLAPLPPQPHYAPARIKELVQSGEVKRHGAQFAASRDSDSYIWKLSPDHIVFFVSRNKEFFGEFRDETLSAGRLLEVIESYIAEPARSSRKTLALAMEQIPFIRKKTTYDWEEGVWIGSTIEWQFVQYQKDGSFLASKPPFQEKMVKRKITLDVPENLRPKAVSYYINAHRVEASEYDQAFGEDLAAIVWSPLERGTCTLSFEWALDRPAMAVDLLERLPNPPMDANLMMIRTKIATTMVVKEVPERDERVIFRP